MAEKALVTQYTSSIHMQVVMKQEEATAVQPSAVRESWPMGVIFMGTNIFMAYKGAGLVLLVIHHHHHHHHQLNF